MGETPEEVTERWQISTPPVATSSPSPSTCAPLAPPAPPPRRAVGQARGVRRTLEGCRRDGFAGVMAGPLVRSSYRAGRLYAQAMAHHGRELPEAQRHLTEGGDASQEASSLMARLNR